MYDVCSGDILALKLRAFVAQHKQQAEKRHLVEISVQASYFYAFLNVENIHHLMSSCGFESVVVEH